MVLTSTHYLAVAVTLLIVSLAGIYSVKFIRTAEDFAVGGRNMGPGMIAGSLVGSFVGGTSTIGTAQLAYRTGISAVWFTLGAGLACLVLGVWLAKPLREAEVDTIPQFLRIAYGDKVTVWAGCYTFLGIFIQIMAQILAFIPLVTSLAPIAPTAAAGFAAGLILLYVIFGGFWGTSLVGFVKLILLYTVLLAGGLISYAKLGGWTGIQNTFSTGKTLSLFPQGVAHNLADGFSVIIGFISTQTYLQAVFAGKNSVAARKGVFITAVILPVIGIVCSLIGLYMREVEPNIPSAAALPMFAAKYLPPYLGGILIGTMIVSLIITGAGLTLGAVTILIQDLAPRFRIKPSLKSMRAAVVAVIGVALGLVLVDTQSLILKYAFLSMALRGVTVFVPLVGAIFWQAKLNPASGVRAVAAAPLAAVGWYVLGIKEIDPLYIGLTASVCLMFFGFSFDNAKNYRNLQDS